MKEILFRGKRIDNGEWVDGYYYESKIRGCFILSPKIKVGEKDGVVIKDSFEIFEVIPETVGQYTGLTDKNGKKIFEGDIVKAIQTEYDEDKEKEPFVFKVIGEMIFEDGCFGLRAKRFVDFYATMWQEDNVELEVIGNIHDNSELLEVEE